MIDYATLVHALDSWRQSQGLPVSATVLPPPTAELSALSYAADVAANVAANVGEQTAEASDAYNYAGAPPMPPGRARPTSPPPMPGFAPVTADPVNADFEEFADADALLDEASLDAEVSDEVLDDAEFEQDQAAGHVPQHAAENHSGAHTFEASEATAMGVGVADADLDADQGGLVQAADYTPFGGETAIADSAPFDPSFSEPARTQLGYAPVPTPVPTSEFAAEPAVEVAGEASELQVEAAVSAPEGVTFDAAEFDDAAPDAVEFDAEQFEDASPDAELEDVPVSDASADDDQTR